MKNKYEVFGKEVFIYYNDFIILIDAKDLLKVSSIEGTWAVRKIGNVYYALFKKRVNGKSKTTLMHRFILDVKEPRVLVDHKDNNGLNNKRKNLREANKSENEQNAAKARGKSGILNVSWDKKRKNWVVQIKKNYKVIYGGRFDDIEKAKNRAKELRKKLFPFSKEAERGLA
jgi:hypothetical protein